MTQPWSLISVLSKPAVCESQDSMDVTVHSASTLTENPQRLGAGRDRQGVGAWLTTARQWMLLKSVYSIREAGRGFLETLQAMSCGSLKPNHLHLVQYAPVYLGNFH